MRIGLFCAALIASGSQAIQIRSESDSTTYTDDDALSQVYSTLDSYEGMLQAMKDEEILAQIAADIESESDAESNSCSESEG